MPVQFDSLAAALAMGGHGAYVWTVYLIAALVVMFLLGAFWFRRFELNEAEHAKIRAELDLRAATGRRAATGD